MSSTFLIGLDYGSESARGVLVDVATGRVEAVHAHPYRHGILTEALPDGTPLPPGWALQVASDYEEAVQAILARLGRGRQVAGIGIGVTASSPLPARADGTPLSVAHPAEPHAYVKLWKHAAAQPWADRCTASGDRRLAGCGGKLSANSLIAKAAELSEEAPDIWAEAERFVEAGDWLVWRLTGRERRSMAFAGFKALHDPVAGYPADLVPGLGGKLATPSPVGSVAGPLSTAWRERTGILGEAVVAVAVIDSHAVLPAVGAVAPGTLVGALGTSAVWLLLDDGDRALPDGIEGVARDATLPNLACFEAGQASFGDALAWFARTFPRGNELGTSLAAWSEEAERLPPAASGLVALDWFNGNRVPYGDATLSGMITGLTLHTTGAEMFRALVEGLCFGACTIVDRLVRGGMPVERVVLTSGLAQRSPFVVRTMAEVLGREVAVPSGEELTAVGAAIHGAVAGGVAADYAEGARRFGTREAVTVRPDPGAVAAFRTLAPIYRAFADDASNRTALRALAALRR